MLGERWKNGRWATREIPVIGGVALLVLGLGAFGWWQQDPAGSFLDHLYRSVQLFVVSYEGTDPVWSLQAARFLAVGVAFYAVLRVITAVLSSQITVFLASRDKAHSVLIGTGPEIRGLAQGIRRGASRGSVSVVGELADEEAAQLSAEGVRVLPGLSQRELAAVLCDASRVIVVGESDDETVRLLSGVVSASSTADRTMVLESPDMTREWLQRPAVAVHAVCRSTQVALETLRTSPPYPGEHAVPHPLVIGDGLLASELVRRILVAGWRDGRRPIVHCLSVGSTFAAALRGDGLDHSLRVSEEPCLTTASVAAAARLVMSGWARPPLSKGRSSGLRAYVALARGSDSLPVARALLRELPDARVAVIVDDAQHWTTSLGASEDRLVWISRGTLLSDLAVLKRSAVDLLADEVAADARAWPPESPSIFGRLVHDTAGHLVDVRPDDARVGIGIGRLVADDARLAFEVLEAGGLRARPGARPCEPPLVGPAQLREMSRVLLSGMEGLLPTGLESTTWALETAARLPGLIQCAGWGVRSCEESLLDDDAVERLAPLVHQAYVDRQAELRNPTQSALATAAWGDMSEFYQASNRAVVRDYPVKLALVGLDWRRSDNPVVHHLTEEQLDLLAEAEHRRWSHFQRRNGAEGHNFVKPWPELGSERGLDRSNVEMMAGALATEGIEIFDSRQELAKSCGGR